VEEVAKLMEDSAEAIAYQDQISELLGSQLTTDDDAAAEVELERIEMEEAAKLEFPELPARPVEIVAERQVQEPRPEQVLVE
jgi:charged multivesicular body protein 6